MPKSSSGVHEVEETSNAGRSGRKEGSRAFEGEKTTESEICTWSAIWFTEAAGAVRCVRSVDFGGEEVGRNDVREGEEKDVRRRKKS